MLDTALRVNYCETRCEPDKRLCLSRTKKCILAADGARPME
jgi:hypothetical protein